MPRGVYDRSKTKAERDAEKSTGKKTAKKATSKGGYKAKTAAAAPSFNMENLTIFMNLRAMIGAEASFDTKGKLDTLINHELDLAIADITPAKVEEPVKNVEVTKPAPAPVQAKPAPAPVAFNAPAPAPVPPAVGPQS